MKGGPRARRRPTPSGPLGAEDVRPSVLACRWVGAAPGVARGCESDRERARGGWCFGQAPPCHTRVARHTARLVSGAGDRSAGPPRQGCAARPGEWTRATAARRERTAGARPKSGARVRAAGGGVAVGSGREAGGEPSAGLAPAGDAGGAAPGHEPARRPSRGAEARDRRGLGRARGVAPTSASAVSPSQSAVSRG